MNTDNAGRDYVNEEIVVCVEMCINCGSHNWNTRHVEDKYSEFFGKSKQSFEQFWIDLISEYLDPRENSIGYRSEELSAKGMG